MKSTSPDHSGEDPPSRPSPVFVDPLFIPALGDEDDRRAHLESLAASTPHIRTTIPGSLNKRLWIAACFVLVVVVAWLCLAFRSPP